MDIDLLAKMVKELILDNDEVTLPGVGCFVAEVVPASFSDRGYTVNPPYRRLFFRQREKEGDSLLVDLYARSNEVSVADARRILEEFLGQMKAVLQDRKTLLFPGLGRLRATRENNFFFVADEDLDIYPAGFGLEPISLKTHQETPEEVSAAVAGLRRIVAPESEADPGAAGVVAGAVEVSALAEAATAEPVAESVDAPAEMAAEAVAVSASADPAAVEPVAEELIAEPVDVPAEMAAEAVAVAALAEPATAEPVAEPAAAEPVAESVDAPAEPAAAEPVAEPVDAPAEPAAVEPVAEPVDSPAEPAAAEPVAEPVDSPAEPMGDQPDETALDDKGFSALSATEPIVSVEQLEEEAPVRKSRTGLWILFALIMLALIALAVFLILSRVTPDFIDRILYTPEELDILRR